MLYLFNHELFFETGVILEDQTNHVISSIKYVLNHYPTVDAPFMV